jgi:tetratricopeptide (TPR) repeat protein
MYSSPTLRALLIPISCVTATAVVAQEFPEKALKYHEALLKRPHNTALFDRFFGAWIDEQSVETLEAFLKARAEANGGQNWTVLATYQLRRGKEDDALSALAKGIEAVPDDAALPMERAKLRLRRMEFDGAREDLAKVTAGKDEVLALEAAKLIGKSWLRQGQTEQAVKAWDAVLAAHPGDEDLLEDLVETAAAESETAQALVYADKLIATSRDPYQKTLRMLRRGDLLAQAGRHDEAVEAYSAIFNQVGEGTWLEREVLAQIEKVFRKQDRIDDLTTELKKLAETFPQRLLIHRQLAKLEATQGEVDAAIGRFREVLKRTPGDKELREEFVRLLTDGEKFDDAATEVEKLIELSPADSGLYLQVAAIRFRQGKPEMVLAALQKARELLGKDEGNGLRIAGLMLQYELKEPGEALLKELGNAADAGPMALEALAAQYGRTERKEEAIELLKKAAAGDDVDVLLRNAGAISALGESGIAFEMLKGRSEPFSADPRFLAALAQAALAAAKPEEAVPFTLKLVRLSKQSGELAENINLASRVITGADKVDEVRTALASQAERSAAETCLLAALIEDGGDFVGVGKLLDGNVDSLVLHFHAALLDRRGDFDNAIATLSRLADTEEGKKAAYFKDLSELQQRAGKIPEALATVERWKLSAPGDKTAWITGSRLLRESGKPDDAVKMLRQAVGRFEGDNDLAASLASFHEEVGNWQDAEAIYWKLYDEGQNPTDQARWAVQLAQLAQKTAKTDELEEKLRERARSNRKSIGPILALAELARITNDENKRRDLLLEAVRLQPKDVDLRLQIASLEDLSGNPERVVALLEEALPFDANSRIRSALAQAYLRQGQVVKGMRELRLVAGKTGFDPRAAESAAASLAGAKLYEEAVMFLRAELPDGGDWRSRYLLAIMLEEDGREAEAIPIFMSLLQAQGEIPKLIPAQVGPNQKYFDQLSKDVQDVLRLVTANQTAYPQKANQNGISFATGQGATKVGPFFLPNTLEELKQFSLIHLSVLSQKKNVTTGDSIRSQLKAAGIENAPFIADLAGQSGGMGNMGKLLENHPGQPGLMEFVLTFTGYNSEGVDDKLVRQLLEKTENLSPTAKFSGWMMVALKSPPEDSAWASLFAAARACIDDKNASGSQNVIFRLMFLLQGQQGSTCPEVHKPAVQELMLAAYKAADKDDPQSFLNYYSLMIVGLAGNADAWIGEINKLVRESHKAPAQTGFGMGNRTRFGQILQQVSRSSGSGGYNPWNSVGNLFDPPSLKNLPVRSIPLQVTSQFSNQNDFQMFSAKPLLTASEMVKRSEQLESPYLRAWLALQAEDKVALAKAMTATPPQEEACDFEMLRAVVAMQDKKLPEAFSALLKARTVAGSDREISGSINLFLIAVAGAMSVEERTVVADELQATFLQSRQVFGPLGAQVLAAQARKLGLEDLAKRIEPPVPPRVKGGQSAVRAAPIAGTSSSSSSSPSDRIQKLVAEKKYEAAARETLQGIRSANTQSGASYYQYQVRNLLERLGKEGQAELIKLADPGDSKSLVKRLEYADICRAAGMSAQALPVLEALAKERPDDVGITARLAFAIPVEQVERQLELMTKSCKDEGFTSEASSYAATILEGNNAKLALDFAETVTRWLETTDPKLLSDVNLTWVPYHAKSIFDNNYNLGLPSLLSDNDNSRTDKKAAERHKMICERLARALMRHDSCAEEGFRLLSAPTVWKLDPVEKDALARKALLAAAKPATGSGQWRSSQQQQFFVLVQGNGSNSSGEELLEYSSASWLAKRLGEVKSPAEILTPDFIEEIKQTNPKVAEIVLILSREIKKDDLTTLWNSEIMKSGTDRVSQMMQSLVLHRIATTPGATKFLTDKIAAIKPGEAVNSNGNREDNPEALFLAAISSSAMGKPGELDTVAKAISKAVFGDKIEFTETTGQVDYRRVNFMSNLTQKLGKDAVLMARYAAAFLRIGVPITQGDNGATRAFQNKRFAKAEEAEVFLESLGWLSDVERWEPYACISYDTSSSAGNSMIITAEPVLLLDRVFQYFGNGAMKRADLVTRLKERKTGRFGALMCAAALSSGKERSNLAGQAFTESSGALAKLSPERVEAFELVLPWLPNEVRAKLPASFRAKLEGVESKKREEAIAAADKYIETLKAQAGNQNRGSRDLSEVVARLIPYDQDKAVEVFAASEQAYTDSLARGARYSNSSSDDWQFSMRDYEFYQALQPDSGSNPFTSNPKQQLRFIEKILATPAGKRLSWLMSYREENVFTKAVAPLMKKEKRSSEIGDVADVVENFQSLEPELRNIAFPCFMLTKLSTGTIENPKQREAVVSQVSKMVASDPQAARLATIRLAQWSWKACTPEEKTEARSAITALLSDESIPDVARVMIAAELLASLPKEEILDPAACTALTKLYQEYCAGERTAVTKTSDALFKALVKSPMRDEAVVALCNALAEAFWANTALPKTAGHPQIPASLAQSTFIAAVLGNNTELVGKTFPRIRALLAGKLVPLVSLIELGQLDFAKQLFPAPADPFSVQQNNLTYNRALEESLATFKQSGIDPVNLQKLEFELLNLPLGKNEMSPAESQDLRMNRMLESFTSSPPHETLMATTLNTLLRRFPSDPALLTALDVWAKANPPGNLLGQESQGNSPTSGRTRDAALTLHGISTMQSFAAGDTSKLKILGDAIEAPRSDRNSSYRMASDLTTLIRGMSRTIWSQVCLGNTDGYKEGLAAWNDFAIKSAEAITYSYSQLDEPLATSHFLACWVGDPAAFDRMCELLAEKPAQSAKKFNRMDGFNPFMKSVSSNTSLELLRDSISRRVFLEKALAQPGFATTYPISISWVQNLANQGNTEAIADIIENPPASLPPQLLPALYGYKARTIRQKDPAAAIAAGRKALELCPDVPANKTFRGYLKRDLAEIWSIDKQADEAKKALASLTPDEIADEMRASYLALAKKLEVKPVVQALPEKKPTPSKKD